MDSRRQAAKTFRDLIVWQKAHELVLAIYQKTQAFPKDEVYALSSQIRRSSMSVAANIAEDLRRPVHGTKQGFTISRKGHCQKRSISCCCRRILSMEI